MALTLVCALAAVSCGNSSSSGKTKIAIVQPMDHTSLNQIRDTIISTLKDLGYDDSNSEIILKNASNDASLLPSIFSSLVSENVDIIIPIGTGTATMMITHDMNAALRLGTRTIMMDDGKVILDISGDERKNMTIDDLLNLYTKESKKQLANDRILLSR